MLWSLRDRFAPGVLFGLYLILAGVERFLVEFIRRNEEVVAGLTQPQLISLALMALGAAIVAVRAPRAARGDGLSAAPSAAAAHRASATDAPAAVWAWKETSMPDDARPPPPPPRPPAWRGAGLRGAGAHGDRRADQHGEHEQRAEPLDGHRHRGGERARAARGA